MQATYSSKLVENLKKAVTEMLILSFLQLKSMSIDEILRYLDEKSNSICKVTYPYAAIHRLLDDNYILEGKKKQAEDRRCRQYYKITAKGKRYLAELRMAYETFHKQMMNIFCFVDARE